MYNDTDGTNRCMGVSSSQREMKQIWAHVGGTDCKLNFVSVPS